jgi:hypothetical protein
MRGSFRGSNRATGSQQREIVLVPQPDAGGLPGGAPRSLAGGTARSATARRGGGGSPGGSFRRRPLSWAQRPNRLTVGPLCPACCLIGRTSGRTAPPPGMRARSRSRAVMTHPSLGSGGLRDWSHRMPSSGRPSRARTTVPSHPPRGYRLGKRARYFPSSSPGSPFSQSCVHEPPVGLSMMYSSRSAAVVLSRKVIASRNCSNRSFGRQ